MPTPTFTPTPAMQALRRTGLHPHVFRDLGATAPKNPIGCILYDPRLRLPDPADQQGILSFLGVSEPMSADIMATAARQFAANPPVPPGRIDITIPYTDRRGFDYPLTRALCDIYNSKIPVGGRHGDWGSTYDGWVQAALTQGLRPEFAMGIGIHEEDPRFRSRQDAEEYHTENSPVDMVREKVGDHMYLLMNLWTQKAKAEEASGVSP